MKALAMPRALPQRHESNAGGMQRPPETESINAEADFAIGVIYFRISTRIEKNGQRLFGFACLRAAI
jgi:hypothetical protein